jgi:hypothetical protein
MEKEKRSAAIHEAGHAVMIERFGGQAEPYIWPNLSRNPGEKSWIGTCIHRVSPDDADRIWSHAPDLRPACPVNWRVYVGAAGLVAEFIDQGIRGPRKVYNMILDYLMRGGMSKTDKDHFLSSESYFSDIKKLIEMLLEEWPKLVEWAQELIEDEANQKLPSHYETA